MAGIPAEEGVSTASERKDGKLVGRIVGDAHAVVVDGRGVGVFNAVHSVFKDHAVRTNLPFCIQRYAIGTVCRDHGHDVDKLGLGIPAKEGVSALRGCLELHAAVNGILRGCIGWVRTAVQHIRDIELHDVVNSRERSVGKNVGVCAVPALEGVVFVNIHLLVCGRRCILEGRYGLGLQNGTACILEDHLVGRDLPLGVNVHVLVRHRTHGEADRVLCIGRPADEVVAGLCGRGECGDLVKILHREGADRRTVGNQVDLIGLRLKARENAHIRGHGLAEINERATVLFGKEA